MMTTSVGALDSDQHVKTIVINFDLSNVLARAHWAIRWNLCNTIDTFYLLSSSVYPNNLIQRWEFPVRINYLFLFNQFDKWWQLDSKTCQSIDGMTQIVSTNSLHSLHTTIVDALPSLGNFVCIHNTYVYIWKSKHNNFECAQCQPTNSFVVVGRVHRLSMYCVHTVVA